MSSPIKSIAINRLGVERDKVAESLAFYRNTLGMDIYDSIASFGPASFGSQGSVALELIPSDGPNQMQTTGYWKIGVGLPDVNAAVKKLQAKGTTVSPGSQFLDVGFLTHLRDAAGYTIELLQDTFESNFVPQPSVERPLACESPKVGQVTLRISDTERSLAFYRGVMGMRMLCWYPVKPYGFSLYFLAFTDEEPPDSNLEGVANREWTYSRPYTTLELQAKGDGTSSGSVHTVPEHGAVGWQGLVFGVSSIKEAVEHLSQHGISPVSKSDDDQEIEIRDPDNYRIFLRESIESPAKRRK